jgi:general secretion pathway protein E
MQMVEGLGDDMDLASLANSVPETEDLLEQEDDAPIIRLINAILTEAVKSEASDVHIETFEKQLIVRFRVDGVLREVVKPKRALAPLLVSRIKVMAKLDIAEKRIPQDGRIALRVGGREVDVRVSTMPSANGERIVLRLLDKNSGRLSLDHMGMTERDLSVIKEIIYRPHGILLVTGPTGSGKTTTLYAGLSQINDRSRNILTVEDPIEYNLPGIGQTQVNTKVDMTFARGLRAILRQDPDVVMIGEIRDIETAEIAVHASLTGHMVLSTLHTNSAIGSITRLMDMGVEPFLISSSMVGIVAQRLVRVLCDSCKAPYEASQTEKEFLNQTDKSPLMIYRAKGCSECNQHGYKGRLGIYEVVNIDGKMRELIHRHAGELELEEQARKSGPSIRDDGITKVLAGVTTIEEIVRVTHGD